MARVWRTFVPRDSLAMRKLIFVLVSMGDDITRSRWEEPGDETNTYVSLVSQPLLLKLFE